MATAMNESRLLACAALLQARSTLAREPALPGSRSLATYRRALSLAWGESSRLSRSRAKGAAHEFRQWVAASELLSSREAEA